MFSINEHGQEAFRVPTGDCIFLKGNEFQSYAGNKYDDSEDDFMDQTSMTLVDAKNYWLPKCKTNDTIYDWCLDLLSIIKVVSSPSAFDVSLICNPKYVPCVHSQNNDFAEIKIWTFVCDHIDADKFDYLNVTPDRHLVNRHSTYNKVDQNFIIRTLLSRAANDFVTNASSWFEFEDDSYIDILKKIERAIMIINWEGNYPDNCFFATSDIYQQHKIVVCHDGFIMEGKTKKIEEIIESNTDFLFDSEMDLFYRTPLKATGKIMQQKYIPFIAAFGYLLATVSCSRKQLDLNRSFITHAAFKDWALFDMTKFFLSLMARYSNGQCLIKINMYNHVRNDFDFVQLPWPFKDYRKMELDLYKTRDNLNIQCLKFYYDCINVLISFHADLLCCDYTRNVTDYELHKDEYRVRFPEIEFSDLKVTK